MQDWISIIDYLYQNDGTFESSASPDVLPDDSNGKSDKQNEVMCERLIAELDLNAADVGDVEDVIDHLKTTDLIDQYCGVGLSRISLTSKGFEVAHDREQAKRDHKTNQALVLFTLLLVLTHISDMALYRTGSKLVTALVLLGMIIGFIWFTDLLDFEEL